MVSKDHRVLVQLDGGRPLAYSAPEALPPGTIVRVFVNGSRRTGWIVEGKSDWDGHVLEIDKILRRVD